MEKVIGMVLIYLNYPNPHATVHGDRECGFVPKSPAEGQRWVRITPATFERELERFRTGHYRFGAQAKLNGMWLEVDFGDRAFKEAVGEFLIRVLSERYTPFGRVVLREHC